jgi:hypothetical protein
LSSSRSVIVDDGVTQDPVEPGDYTFFVFKGVLMFYRSKKALLEYIFHDGLIRKAFAKECPKGMFVLDEVMNQVVKDSGS